MNVHPTDLKLTSADQLTIQWSDGRSVTYPVRLLRDHCPCATCRERRRADSETPNLLPVLAIEETQPLRIVHMRPVGNYAYCIGFSDGHDTEIYTLELLRHLGEHE